MDIAQTLFYLGREDVPPARLYKSFFGRQLAAIRGRDDPVDRLPVGGGAGSQEKTRHREPKGFGTSA